MSSDGSYRRFRPEAVEVDDLERALWVVVAASLVGDVVTTFVGLHLGLTESNPVARGVIDGHGLPGMLALKGLAVGVAVWCRTLLPNPYGPIVPAGLAAPWVIAVCVNLYVISTVT